MQDETNDDVVEETEEETIEAPQENETTDDKEARLRRLEENAIRQRERTRALKAENEKLKKALQPKEAPSKNTGELDETQLDYLDLKGISEQDDIKVIESIVAKTGMTVRQALKDEYVVKKLEANKASREVKDATPSATKRSGSGSTDDLALAVAKYKASGFTELPSNFALRAAVVDAVANETNSNKPAWH